MKGIQKSIISITKSFLKVSSLLFLGFIFFYCVVHLFQFSKGVGYFIGIVSMTFFSSKVSKYIEKLVSLKPDKRLLIELLILGTLGMIFISSTYINSHVDEYDNMLGGKYITEGLLPYRDFFSHHLPFTYHLAGLITLISGSDPLRFRFVYLTIMFSWLTYVYFLGKPVLGRRAGLLFVFLVTLISVPIWANMIFAEVLIGYSALHLSLLYLRINSKSEYSPTHLDLLQVAFVGFIPASSSLGFVLLTAFYYIFFLFLFLTKWNALVRENSRNILKQAIKYGLVFSLPFALLLAQLLYTNSFHEFIDQGVNFNREIYSQFYKDIPTSPLSIIFSYVLNIHDTIAFNVGDLMTNPKLIYPMVFRIFSYSFVLILLIKKRYTSAFFFFASFILLNARQGSILSVDRFHEIQTMLFSILSLCLVLQYTKKISGQIFSTLLTINIICLLLLVGFLFEHNQKALIKFEENRVPDVITLETELNKEINNSENIKSVWIGPQSLEHLFFLEKPLATRYYFWLPWHGACEKCKKQIIEDLETNKPELVYWDNDFGVWGYDSGVFGRVIQLYLEENYVYEGKNIYRISR